MNSVGLGDRNTCVPIMEEMGASPFSPLHKKRTVQAFNSGSVARQAELRRLKCFGIRTLNAFRNGEGHVFQRSKPTLK